MVNREDCVIFKQEYGNELLVNQAHVGIRTKEDGTILNHTLKDLKSLNQYSLTLHALEISTATLREFHQSLKSQNIPLFQ